MCGGSGTTATTTNNTTTATPTAEETAMEKTQLAQYQAIAPQQTSLYNKLFSTSSNLLDALNQPGSQSWSSLLGGVTPQQTQSQINTQDKALQSSFQNSGIYDSGTAASGRLRSAADLSNTNAQFNIQTLQQSLNQAMGLGANVQGVSQGTSSQLGQQLAGLRANQTTGSGVYPSTGFNTGIFGTLGTSYYGCWVAATVFECGWNDTRTHFARYYIQNIGPKWFKKLYMKFGERFAKFLKNKPNLIRIIKPFFSMLAFLGEAHLNAQQSNSVYHLQSYDILVNNNIASRGVV